MYIYNIYVYIQYILNAYNVYIIVGLNDGVSPKFKLVVLGGRKLER